MGRLVGNLFVSESRSAEDANVSGIGERPVFTLKEAAEACQVSLKTIRRRRDKGDFPNSYRSASRAQSPWLIPVTDLIAAGLTPGKPAPPEEPAPEPSPEPAELDKLKAEIAELRKRAETAEAVVTERERTIETQATTLKMIEAAPAPVDQLERLAAERDEARANARWGFRRRLRLRRPETEA